MKLKMCIVFFDNLKFVFVVARTFNNIKKNNSLHFDFVRTAMCGNSLKALSGSVAPLKLCFPI